MSVTQDLSIGKANVPGSVVVTVRGDLDAASAPRLKDALHDLREDVDRDVIVDVEGLTFIDSSGVYVLIQALKSMSTEGRHLTLRGADSGAYKVLDVCRLTSVFDLPDAAVRANGSARATS